MVLVSTESLYFSHSPLNFKATEYEYEYNLYENSENMTKYGNHKKLWATGGDKTSDFIHQTVWIIQLELAVVEI